MSRKFIKKHNNYLARIVTEDPKPCAFCHRKVDDEINYGKLYVIGDIQCHYFCALLSCCLVQKGPDNTGLFGFQYKDILVELERCQKHRCSYCGQGGANLGCCVTSCRKQFHLPCGREKQAVSLFYGTFKSFCKIHAPKQKLPDHIMVNAKRRKKTTKALNVGNCAKNDKDLDTSENMVCVICYEEVDGFATLYTFWPPCCAKDAWFHRNCLQRMALSAGMHYLKCPLCNDKEIFYEAVISQGYYVPDRDAAWELEQNAFSEIYERSITCSADDCHCPKGRNHDAETGPWDIKLCLLCGSSGRHLQCIRDNTSNIESTVSDTFVCSTCEPVAPADLDTLVTHIETVIQDEQVQTASNNRHGPVMPSRMSLRRTKGRNAIRNRPSCSRIEPPISRSSDSANITSSRLDLNLKPPRKAPTPKKQTGNVSLSFSPTKNRTDQNELVKDPFTPTKNRTDQNELLKDPFSPTKELKRITKDPFSPTKELNRLIKEPFSPRKELNKLTKDPFSPSKVIEELGEKFLIGFNEDMVEKLRRKILKPRPMCVKKKIVNETLQNLLSTSPKQIDRVREWCSPKKHEFEKNLENTSNKENISTPKKISSPDKENVIKIDPADEDSNSTFQLPPEFIADCHSDDSFNFDTPKCKTVEIKQDSSLEIFEKDQDHSIGIDVLKIKNLTKSPQKIQKSPPKCIKIPKTDTIFKFSPLGKELVDVEDFKKEYLNEVGLKKVSDCTKSPLNTIDFAVNISNLCKNDEDLSGKMPKCTGAVKKPAKRRLSDVPKPKIAGKKRKLSESDLVLHYKLSPVKSNEKEKPIKNNKTKRKKKSKKSDKKLRVTFDSNSKNKKSKLKTKLSVDNKNIKLKIKWKKEQLHLKLESKSEKNKKMKSKSQKSRINLKQYVLQYPVEGKSTDVLVKPGTDVNPLKRKYIKQEKSPDKFKQTSLHSFFKVKSPNDK